MADATIDQQFIEYIVKALVGEPDKVRIERSIDERGVLLELYVGPDDLGRVIGRAGTTAKSIRTLLRALGVKNDARYNLKIVDTNGGGRPRRDDSYNQSSDRPTPADQPAVADEQPVSVNAPVEEVSAPADDQPADQSSLADNEQVEEPQTETDKLDRHREDLKDLTDLDI